MNLFNIYIISIFAYICEGYTLWLYCSGLFERRYNFIKRLLIYIIFYTIPILFIGLRIFSLNCILFFLMTMLIICTAYKVTPGKSMLHALLATFIMCITELIVMVAVPDYGQNVLGYIDSFKVQVMIYYISKLLYLIFMYIASYIHFKKGTSRHNINIKNICTCRNMCNKRFHYKFFLHFMCQYITFDKIWLHLYL